MLKAVPVIGLAIVAAALAATPATAFGIQSVETDLTLDDCTTIHSNDFETTWACPGYKGIPVMLNQAKLHYYVSYGLTSTEEPAARQSPPPPNTLGDTIEWRISNKEGAWKAFATILRYKFPAHDKVKAGEVLVVTRIEPGATCEIAYVDALANADAVALAEQAADAHGFDFDCKTGEPVKIGKFTAW